MVFTTRSPVLFLVFRRPETTRRVFETIRQAQPPYLFVAGDGPRDERERELCEQARTAATAVDWPCEVRTLFRASNLGVRRAVTGSLDWFFDHVEEGIVLEDDCLPDPTFFRFCDELLERYREEDRVMSVSGDSFHGRAVAVPESYFFSRYCYVWGWATWRRAWQHNQADMADWPGLRASGWLDRLDDGHADFRRFWRWVFDETYRGRIDTWDHVWTFSCWLRDGVSAVPTTNLVSNIGMGVDASHTHARDWRARIPRDAMAFPLRHPAEVARHRAADRWADLHVYGTRFAFPWIRRIVRHVPGAPPFVRAVREGYRRLFAAGGS